MLRLARPKKMKLTVAQQYMFFYDTANTMPVDALATLGARATAGMVLTPKVGIFYLQHQES